MVTPSCLGGNRRTDRQLRHAPVDGRTDGHTDGPVPQLRVPQHNRPPPPPTASSATAPRRVRPLCRPGRSLIAANWHPGTGAAGTHRERGAGRGWCGPVSHLGVHAGVTAQPGLVSVPSPFPRSPLLAGRARGGAARCSRCLSNGGSGGGLISSPSRAEPPRPAAGTDCSRTPPTPIPVPCVHLPTRCRGWGRPGAPCPRPCAQRRPFLPSLSQCVFDDLSGSVSLSWVGDSTGVRRG